MIDALTRVAVLPLWSGPVEPRIMAGGLSNVSYYVEDAGQAYVVRLGRDLPLHHVFRANELMVTRAAATLGFSPEIVYSGPGVMVGRYVQATTLSAGDVRASIGRLAPMLRRFHSEMPPLVSGPAVMFWPFHVIRDYVQALRHEHHRSARLAQDWVDIANEMEAAQAPMPIVFGHNDLIPANIIDDGRRLWFIDYEYSGFSTALCDLAGMATNADFDDAANEELLVAYFGGMPGAAVRRSYDAMLCAAALREALWGMVSEFHIDMPTDFAGYAALNLERFRQRLAGYRARSA